MQHIFSRSEQLAPEPQGVGAPDPDVLGTGSMLLGSVFALLVGGVVGLITTFTHAQFAPWGLVAGLLVVCALVLGFRLVFSSRVIAAAAAVGAIAACAALALPGAGGTVLALTSPLGWIWALGPGILSLVVLLWPAPRAPRGASTSA